jgi:hypothetical protein
MLSRGKRLSHGVIPVCCCMMLTILLAACGGSGNGNPTPASTPTPKPSPTPTSIALTTYKGNGFTISYPQSWKVTKSSSGGISFADSTNTNDLLIEMIPDPNGFASSDTLADTEMNVAKASFKKAQTEIVPATTTVGGETWSQRSISGPAMVNGQNLDMQVVLIVDVHPAHSASSQGYTILYGSEKSLFVQENTTYFQTMLHSFQFA